MGAGRKSGPDVGRRRLSRPDVQGGRLNYYAGLDALGA